MDKPVLGLIGGTGFTELGLEEVDRKLVKTPHGEASSEIVFFDVKGKVLACLFRHGDPRIIPPHMVNHRANIYALKEVGVEKIIGVNSVGGLRQGMPVPSIVIPHDYVNFSPPTYFDDKIFHITPGLSEELRKGLKESASDLGIGVIFEGVYVQMRGPRLETPAEIKIIQKWGDVVGMNAASEATLAKELELEYCSVCTVDNHAHGLSEEVPTYQEILNTARANTKKVNDIILNYVEAYL